MRKKSDFLFLDLFDGASFKSIFNKIGKFKFIKKHQEVYNEFEYKKELENKYDAVVSARKRTLDSLEIQINALAKNIQNSEVNKERNIQNYQYLAAQFQNKQQISK